MPKAFFQPGERNEQRATRRLKCGPSTRMKISGMATRMISARGSRTSRRRSLRASVQITMRAVRAGASFHLPVGRAHALAEGVVAEMRRVVRADDVHVRARGDGAL